MVCVGALLTVGRAVSFRGAIDGIELGTVVALDGGVVEFDGGVGAFDGGDVAVGLGVVEGIGLNV